MILCKYYDILSRIPRNSFVCTISQTAAKPKPHPQPVKLNIPFFSAYFLFHYFHIYNIYHFQAGNLVGTTALSPLNCLFFQRGQKSKIKPALGTCPLCPVSHWAGTPMVPPAKNRYRAWYLLEVDDKIAVPVGYSQKHHK